MIDLAKVTINVFGWCTQLYPRDFRQEYGQELLGVFDERMNDAVRDRSLVKFILRESRDLPINILKEHLTDLRKMFGRKQSPAPVPAWRTILAGALGFGLGMALLMLIRWISDLGNDPIFSHYGLGLLRETILYGMIGGIGWRFISRGLFPPAEAKRLVWRGFGFGALSGLLGILFFSVDYFFPNAYAYFHVNIWIVRILGILISMAGFGGPIAYETEFRKRFFTLIAAASLCFGVGFLASEGLYTFYYVHYGASLMAWDWWARNWELPMMACAAVNGLVGGALWGWVVSRVAPPRTGRERIIGSKDPDSLDSESQQFLNQPTGLGRIKSNYIILRRYP